MYFVLFNKNKAQTKTTNQHRNANTRRIKREQTSSWSVIVSKSAF